MKTEVKIIEAWTDGHSTKFDLSALDAAQAMCLIVDALARVSEATGKPPVEIAREVYETGRDIWNAKVEI